jgi:O-antigen/teichoic acid export membrane protein
MFEYNFRSGTIIGIVGAGGIGYYIDLYLRFLQYDKVVAYLLIIFFVVLVIDFFSIYARSFFNEEDDLRSSSWSEVFLGIVGSADKTDDFSDSWNGWNFLKRGSR